MGQYIKVRNGVKIFLEDVGQGSPIFFIHGWPVDHRMFEYQFTQLPKYGLRCLALDLPGFGKSDRPWNGYSYDSLADDVYSVIETLSLKDVTLVGFSMGGAIAIRYMARHFGRRISRLVLAGAAAPSFTKRFDYPYGFTKDEVNQLILATYKDRPKMLENFGLSFFASQVSAPFRDWFQLLGLEASNHGTVKCAESLRDEDLREDLWEISVPTAIFHGMLDKICPFQFARLMHQGIKNSWLIPFEKSGHGLFYDELEKFNDELMQFISKTSSKRG